MVKVIRTYSDQWKELRPTCVGASEIPALLGLNPWRKAAQVWDRREKHERSAPSDGINSRIWWGHQEEPSIIAAAIHEIWGQEPVFSHPGYSWVQEGFMASPDSVITRSAAEPEGIMGADTCVIEAKTVGARMASWWRHGPPTYVVAQVHAQMAVAGAGMGYVAARIAGDPVKAWEVPRAPDGCKAMLDLVAEFWRHESKPADWEKMAHEVLDIFMEEE